jgi:hypothetical protein
LQNRPFLHNSSLTLLISITIIIIGLLSHNWMCYTFGWICLTASFTHHLRDALRHGFWFSPFHTKPVPFWVYVLILTSYPLLCSWIMDIMAQKFLQTFQNQNFKYISLKTQEVWLFFIVVYIYLFFLNEKFVLNKFSNIKNTKFYSFVMKINLIELNIGYNKIFDKRVFAVVVVQFDHKLKTE